MEEQEERNIVVRITTKYAILMNFMVVILNRGLDKNNQLLSDDSNIYHDLGVFYKEVGRMWKESAPELMGVKLFLDNVQLVQLKKYGSSSSRWMEKT